MLLLAFFLGLAGCDTALFVDRHRGRADYVLNAASLLILLCKALLFELLELTLRFGLLLILLLRLFILPFTFVLIQDDVAFLLDFLEDVIVVV